MIERDSYSVAAEGKSELSANSVSILLAAPPWPEHSTAPGLDATLISWLPGKGVLWEAIGASVRESFGKRKGLPAGAPGVHRRVAAASVRHSLRGRPADKQVNPVNTSHSRVSRIPHVLWGLSHVWFSPSINDLTFYDRQLMRRDFVARRSRGEANGYFGGRTDWQGQIIIRCTLCRIIYQQPVSCRSARHI